MSDDYYRYSTDDDLASIVRLIEAHSHAADEGYPAFVEPEPATSKGRFGRTKEAAVDHGVGIHVADPSSGSMEAMFFAPDDPAIRFEYNEFAVAAGWAPESSMPGSGRLVSAGRPDAASTARWIVDTLKALGAEPATGRWRCYSPEMPGWWSSA